MVSTPSLRQGEERVASSLKPTREGGATYLTTRSCPQHCLYYTDWDGRQKWSSHRDAVAGDQGQSRRKATDVAGVDCGSTNAVRCTARETATGGDVEIDEASAGDVVGSSLRSANAGDVAVAGVPTGQHLADSKAGQY